MGFLGPTPIEQAVYHQLGALCVKLWGNHFDSEKGLQDKERRLSELEQQFLQIEDRKLRKARLKWIKDGRQSITWQREQIKAEQIKLPPIHGSRPLDHAEH